ncbi:hypothetical protein ACFWU3_33325, partial [Streptomyces sp. NPDC058685]
MGTSSAADPDDDRGDEYDEAKRDDADTGDPITADDRRKAAYEARDGTAGQSTEETGRAGATGGEDATAGEEATAGSRVRAAGTDVDQARGEAGNDGGVEAAPATPPPGPGPSTPGWSVITYTTGPNVPSGCRTRSRRRYPKRSNSPNPARTASRPSRPHPANAATETRHPDRCDAINPNKPFALKLIRPSRNNAFDTRVNGTDPTNPRRTP